MEHAFSAATRHFPQSEFAIGRLIGSSEDFRDICEELAEAEQALDAVAAMPPELRDLRRAEWQVLVDRLIAELAIALRDSEAQSRRGSR